VGSPCSIKPIAETRISEVHGNPVSQLTEIEIDGDKAIEPKSGLHHLRRSRAVPCEA
jgi:hypothetical protein